MVNPALQLVAHTVYIRLMKVSSNIDYSMKIVIHIFLRMGSNCSNVDRQTTVGGSCAFFPPGVQSLSPHWVILDQMFVSHKVESVGIATFGRPRTEVLVLRPLLEDQGRITESIRILVPVNRMQ